MIDSAKSFLQAAWPFLGWVYLLYLALQPAPVTYVGIGGLVVITPLLLGWIAGTLFGIGPWANPPNGTDVDTD